MIRSKPSLVAFTALLVAAVLGSFLVNATAQRRRATTHAKICGNPTLLCKTSITFEPYALPFRVPKNAVIVDTEPFYAVILESIGASEEHCDAFVSERERLQAQALFPHHKVFTSRCVEPGNLFYTDENNPKVATISDRHRIMAIYAGPTLADANRMLATVQATKKFSGNACAR